MKSIKDLTDQVKKAEEGAEKRTAQAMEVENQLNTIMTEMQHLEPKQRYIRYTCPRPHLQLMLWHSSCLHLLLACLLLSCSCLPVCLLRGEIHTTKLLALNVGMALAKVQLSACEN